MRAPTELTWCKEDAGLDDDNKQRHGDDSTSRLLHTPRVNEFPGRTASRRPYEIHGEMRQQPLHTVRYAATLHGVPSTRTFPYPPTPFCSSSGSSFEFLRVNNVSDSAPPFSSSTNIDDTMRIESRSFAFKKRRKRRKKNPV